MNGKKLFPLFLLLFALALSSCSGPKGGIVCTVNCGGGGGSSLFLIVTAATRPDSVPGTISILSFTANISGISITSGSTPFTITPSNPNVDLNKLLSDTVYLGQANPSSSLLSGSTITIESAEVVYCTSTAGAGCDAGSIQTVKTTGSQQVADGALPNFPSGSTKLALRLFFDLQNALVLNPAGTAVTSIDFTRALAQEWVVLPSAANLSTSQADYVEDILGVVTNVNTAASTITLQSQTAGTFTANVVSGTTNFSGNCGTTLTIACAVVGQVADIDTILNDDGTFTLLLFDPLVTTSTDWVEGVIGYAPTAGNQFQLVVTNFQPALTNSSIGTSLHLGDPVTVNLSNGISFGIDAKNLLVEANGFSGASDTSVLAPGQVVAVTPTSFTAANGATPASVNVNNLELRFTHVSGAPSAPGPNFQFTATGQYFGANLATTLETTGVTNYDLSSAGSSVIPVTPPAALRALYFGSNVGFAIAKVRQ